MRSITPGNKIRLTAAALAIGAIAAPERARDEVRPRALTA